MIYIIYIIVRIFHLCWSDHCKTTTHFFGGATRHFDVHRGPASFRATHPAAGHGKPGNSGLVEISFGVDQPKDEDFTTKRWGTIFGKMRTSPSLLNMCIKSCQLEDLTDLTTKMMKKNIYHECLRIFALEGESSSQFWLTAPWDDPRQQRGNGKGVQMARAAQWHSLSDCPRNSP